MPHINQMIRLPKTIVNTVKNLAVGLTFNNCLNISMCWYIDCYVLQGLKGITLALDMYTYVLTIRQYDQIFLFQPIDNGNNNNVFNSRGIHLTHLNIRSLWQKHSLIENK